MSGRAALADDTTDCGVPPEAGARGATELTWARGADGWIAPTLQVRAPDVDDLQVRVQADLSFSGRSWTWRSERMPALAYDTVEVDIEGLDEARFADEQLDYLSTLSVQVELLSAKGDLVTRMGAPTLYVAFDRHGALLLDEDEGEELSTNGAWSEAARAEVEATRVAGDEDLVLWFGEVTP